jgi:hypothetical protein
MKIFANFALQKKSQWQKILTGVQSTGNTLGKLTWGNHSRNPIIK